MPGGAIEVTRVLASMNSAAVEAEAGVGSGAREGAAPSLSQSHRSIAVPAATPHGAAWRRALVFFGPGYLVAVGYMDPGNWATSLAGGSQFGYALLSVILVSNLIAMLFQAAAVRLGIAAGLDLAQACRRHFSPRVSLALWLFCEVAIVACNLAEVIGMAIGLNLLFGLPLVAGVVVTLLDVVLLLALQRRGFRWLEAAIIALVATIGVCFAFQIAWLQPSLAAVARRPRAAAGHRRRSGHALPRGGHRRRHGDAAQPVPALVARADAPPRSLRGAAGARRSASRRSTPRSRSAWRC